MRRGSGLEAVGFFVALPSAVFSKPPAKDAAKWDTQSVASTSAVARGLLLLLLFYVYG